MMQSLIFYSLASLLILNSAMVVTRKNPVASAVFLIATLFIMAAMFAFLGADFVAAIQVLIYAGAIMVLFLFVIMLLNLDPEQLTGPRLTIFDIAVLLISVIGLVAMSAMVLPGSPVQEFVGPFDNELMAAGGGNTNVLGLQLFQNYVWPFEIASVLILLAIVASVMIAKKEKSST